MFNSLNGLGQNTPGRVTQIFRTGPSQHYLSNKPSAQSGCIVCWWLFFVVDLLCSFSTLWSSKFRMKISAARNLINVQCPRFSVIPASLISYFSSWNRYFLEILVKLEFSQSTLHTSTVESLIPTRSDRVAPCYCIGGMARETARVDHPSYFDAQKASEAFLYFKAHEHDAAHLVILFPAQLPRVFTSTTFDVNSLKTDCRYQRGFFLLSLMQTKWISSIQCGRILLVLCFSNKDKSLVYLNLLCIAS